MQPHGGTHDKFGYDNRYDRSVDVMEETVNFTLPTRSSSALITDRCGACDEPTEQRGGHMNMQAI